VSAPTEFNFLAYNTLPLNKNIVIVPPFIFLITNTRE